MISYERLCVAIAENNWTLLVDILKPKYFPRDEKGTLIDRKILTKVAETLTAPRADIPYNVRIVLVKCLVNSCVDGYINQKFSKHNNDDESLEDYCHKFYSSLSISDFSNDSAPCFPYDGTVKWAVDYVLKYIENSKDCLEILRLSVQFLCNFSTFACESNNLPHSLNDDDFKTAVITLAGSDYVPLGKAACAYVHNALKNLPKNYYNETQINTMAQSLIDADKLEIQSAGEALELLLKRSGWLQTIYQDLTIDSNLRLLEIIQGSVCESVYQENDSETSTNFPIDVVQFLSERFKKRSDLILKTVDSYLDGMEPTEITLLLDVIAVISSGVSVECHILQNDKSLMINCIFLLKSLHMAGRASENHFTPVQKLSQMNQEITGNSLDDDDIQNHPAFGFKAALIRAIGNLAHKHKGNQDLDKLVSIISGLLRHKHFQFVDTKEEAVMTVGAVTRSSKLYLRLVIVAAISKQPVSRLAVIQSSDWPPQRASSCNFYTWSGRRNVALFWIRKDCDTQTCHRNFNLSSSSEQFDHERMIF